MIETSEFVHSLENVKLVLGNGFDLHCKLHSSYWNYFQKHRTKYNYVCEWLKKYLNEHKCFVDNQFSVSIETTHLNIWDYFFGILKTIDKNTKKHEWCDIENILYKSLMSLNASDFVLSWPFVYRLVNNRLDASKTYPYADALAAVLSAFNNEVSKEEDFYDFLLDELKKFEKNFGLFIFNQHKNINRKYLLEGLINDRYINCAGLTISSLCNLDNVTSIDLFNYVGTGIPKIDDKINYINGDFSQPIFGIRTLTNSDNPKYIFTKVNRRIMNDMSSNKIEQPKEFKNLIVYGHSLNEFDHNYFFPILDKMKLADTINDSVFVFAYSVYDENKRSEIEKENRVRVYSFIKAYAKSRKYSLDVIETLSIQKRIVFFEIPEITDMEHNYKTHFDDAEYEDESE